MAGYGFGYRFSRRQISQVGGPGDNDSILYGPNYGRKGPTKFLVSVWTQRPVGYCYETDNFNENLYAKWKARGINTIKQQHPDFVVEGQGDAMLAAVEAEGLMLLSSPVWAPVWGNRPSAQDYRTLAMTDDYWRTKWLAYAFLDEPDLYTIAQNDHFAAMDANELENVRKAGVVNFTWRISSPSVGFGIGNGGTAQDPVVWKEFFEAPQVQEITHDTYNWHLESADSNAASGARESIGYFASTWNMFGPYYEDKDVSIQQLNRSARGRRFTATKVGLNVHLSRNGPIIPQGGTVPQPLSYAPGDKATGHYVATGRVDFVSPTFFRGGLHSPARFLRDDIWAGIVHGSSHVLIFPQAPSGGSMVVTGYVNSTTNRFTVTSTAPHGRNNINGAMVITRADTGATVGWIKRDGFQVSGTANGAGAYALDTAKVPTIAAGSAGTPIQFRLFSAEGTSGDGTNAANAAELTNFTANLARMQAHPTGGNLLMDTAQGGRRSFTVLRCPDMNDDPRLYKEDMTLAPIQPGYTVGGVAVLDAAGEGPGWLFGWPMGFEGFHVLGDDGATYIYVRSLSNSDRPTFFPGFAGLGLPARAFGPFELAGFRRVGAGAAVEMTGTSGVIKAGVDDGAATWFYIETAAITQNEGNSGMKAFNVTVRRGGATSGTNTVTATASGTGISSASASDFQGGVFPSQVLSFAPTETTKVFTINVNGDTAAEFNETFRVALSSPSTGCALVASNKSEITCVISNDDAALASSFIWLGNTLSGAPALVGSPVGAVHLNASETTRLTRGGIDIQSASAGQSAFDGGLFANVPGFLSPNAFSGLYVFLPPGNWEVAFIAASASFGGGISGNVRIVDDPGGANNLRQNVSLSGSGALLMDSDGTQYTNATTAIGSAVSNLTFLPVTVSNRGGGEGAIQIHGTTTGIYLAAVAVRQV